MNLNKASTVCDEIDQTCRTCFSAYSESLAAAKDILRVLCVGTRLQLAAEKVDPLLTELEIILVSTGTGCLLVFVACFAHFRHRKSKTDIVNSDSERPESACLCCIPRDEQGITRFMAIIALASLISGIGLGVGGLVISLLL